MEAIQKEARTIVSYLRETVAAETVDFIIGTSVCLLASALYTHNLMQCFFTTPVVSSRHGTSSVKATDTHRSMGSCKYSLLRSATAAPRPTIPSSAVN